MTTAAPDLETASAEEVLAYAVEQFHPRLKLACSFQKEESVLIHMLSAIGGGRVPIPVFMIDTGVLFAETLETWKRFEDRFGVHVEVVDARSPDEPWTATALRLAMPRSMPSSGRSPASMPGLRAFAASRPPRARRPRNSSATNAAAFGRSIRSPTRSEKDLWRYIYEHELPYHPLHDQGYSSIGCAPCTQPGEGREGRWSGQDKTECGIHE